MQSSRLAWSMVSSRASPQRRQTDLLRRPSACGAASWVALRTSLRHYFVRFQSTPNEDCYKFFVDSVAFLPEGAQTMMFDRENDYQSPIAQHILHALPMVEEVTIGKNFVTVKRVEEASAEAAARYFAMRFHGTTMGGPSGMSDEEQAAAAAARSQALQRRADEAAAEAAGEGREGEKRVPQEFAAAPAQPSTLPPGEVPFFQADGPEAFEMGGFAVKQSSPEDEALDEAAIQQLIEAMSWSELKLHVSALLTDHMFSGEPHVSPDVPHPHADTLPQDGDSEVVLMIKELLATTVRPQLQDDGGDIRFVRFDALTGTMEVELLGACRTCKSSKTTLVDLIERTTRHWIPEVSTVVEVGRRASAFERFAASRPEAAASDPFAAGGAAAGDRSQSSAAQEAEETDPTKIAGEGGVHKRVVVEERMSARVVREIHQPVESDAAAAEGPPAHHAVTPSHTSACRC